MGCVTLAPFKNSQRSFGIVKITRSLSLDFHCEVPKS